MHASVAYIHLQLTAVSRQTETTNSTTETSRSLMYRCTHVHIYSTYTVYVVAYSIIYGCRPNIYARLQRYDVIYRTPRRARYKHIITARITESEPQPKSKSQFRSIKCPTMDKYPCYINRADYTCMTAKYVSV